METGMQYPKLNNRFRGMKIPTESNEEKHWQKEGCQKDGMVSERERKVLEKDK